MRTRTEASTAVESRVRNRPDTDGPVALYSDIVASRPPSPSKETSTSPAEPVEHPSEEVDSEGVFGYSKTEQVAVSTNDPKNIKDYTSSEPEGSESPKRLEDQSWTTVKCRRARSLDSVSRDRKVSREKETQAKKLTKEQNQTVKAAVLAMNTEQSELVQRRQQKIAAHREKSPLSRGEGPSRPKGKGIDPREWGQVNISQESLDVEAQAAALESYAQQSEKFIKKKKSSRDKNKRRNPSSRRREYRERPAESRPAAQIAKNSYLGMALQNVDRRRQKGHQDEDPLPSSPDPSKTSDSADSSEDNSGTSGDESSQPSNSQRSRKRRNNRHGRNKKRRRSSSRSSGSSRPTIKPIPPLEYDGKSDARSYHRFVRESEAYLRDGKVRGRRKVFLLSYYLTDKAYDFYTQKVANDEENWPLRKFYDELFNYCFPVDFRMQMRRALACCHQNELSVTEYTHELQELFNMIGDVPDRDKVLKFWNGSRTVIQKGLWRDNLNPEISTWDQVVSQAEVIEIAENVAERRNRKVGPPQSSGSMEGSSKTKNQPSGRSAQSVTFDLSRRHRGQDRHRSRSTTSHGTRSGSHPSTFSRNNNRQLPGQRTNDNRNSPGGNFSRGKSQSGSSNKPDHPKVPRFSEKEMADLRAAGKCFGCGEEGHIS